MNNEIKKYQNIFENNSYFCSTKEYINGKLLNLICLTSVDKKLIFYLLTGTGELISVIKSGDNFLIQKVNKIDLETRREFTFYYGNNPKQINYHTLIRYFTESFSPRFDLEMLKEDDSHNIQDSVICKPYL